MINTYWTIAITAVLSFCTLLLKTSKAEKKGQFYKLTKTGYVVFTLLFVSLFFNWQSQKNSDLSALNKLKHDSLRFLNKKLADSLSFSKTLQTMQKQHIIDSVNAVNDSNRFKMTLIKFGQQLNKQDSTLGNVNRILNPLFPITISENFDVPIDSISVGDIREYLDTIMKKVNDKNRVHDIPNILVFGNDKEIWGIEIDSPLTTMAIPGSFAVLDYSDVTYNKISIVKSSMINLETLKENVAQVNFEIGGDYTHYKSSREFIRVDLRKRILDFYAYYQDLEFSGITDNPSTANMGFDDLLNSYLVFRAHRSAMKLKGITLYTEYGLQQSFDISFNENDFLVDKSGSKIYFHKISRADLSYVKSKLKK